MTNRTTPEPEFEVRTFKIRYPWRLRVRLFAGRVRHRLRPKWERELIEDVQREIDRHVWFGDDDGQ